MSKRPLSREEMPEDILDFGLRIGEEAPQRRISRSTQLGIAGVGAATVAVPAIEVVIDHPVAAEEHVVQPGETLSGIAEDLHTTTDELAAENGIDDPDRVYADQVLIHDQSVGGRLHTVKKGENLWKIEEMYGLKHGTLGDNWLIQPGQKIAIPARPAVSAPSVKGQFAHGETVSGKMAKIGLTTADWKKVNPGVNPDKVRDDRIYNMPTPAKAQPQPQTPAQPTPAASVPTPEATVSAEAGVDQRTAALDRFRELLPSQKISGVPENYRQLILAKSKEKNIDPAIVAAQIFQESQFGTVPGSHEGETSEAGAMGPGQVMPITLQEYKDETGDVMVDVYSAEGAVKILFWYMDKQINSYKTNYPGHTQQEYEVAALAAYNGGYTGIKEELAGAFPTLASAGQLNGQSRDYMRLIVDHSLEYKDQIAKELNTLEPSQPTKKPQSEKSKKAEFPTDPHPDQLADGTFVPQDPVIIYNGHGERGTNGNIDPKIMIDLGPQWPGHKMQVHAAAAFWALNDAFYKAFGRNIEITDSYRDYPSQIDTKRRKGKYAADPGTSKHGKALALDLGSGINNFSSLEYKWMFDNAPRFGFENPPLLRDGRGVEEAWHWEFATQPRAIVEIDKLQALKQQEWKAAAEYKERTDEAERRQKQQRDEQKHGPKQKHNVSAKGFDKRNIHTGR